MTGACWSTAVCTESERRALGLASDGEWLLTCRLSDGHSGDHATDASAAPRHDRRTWLTWDDSAIPGHRLIDAEPCPMRSREGVSCLLFARHGGFHYYGAPTVPGPAPTSTIDSSDVRMPTGADSLEPLDVEVTTGPTPAPDGTNPFARVDAAVKPDPFAPTVPQQQAPVVEAPVVDTHAAEPAATSEPSTEATTEATTEPVTEPDAVEAALDEVAAALEKLAEAIRRRPS
ncbi:hypothetical protein [Gordonia sp. (in: high G+C Gram-positive bacteria)]|uniref:hypothetical protein n=1 Tax=Gordonia sp. (in: high G+C Gram-positive bacteria) TaxID=84139 RepID=UPI0039E6AE68